MKTTSLSDIHFYSFPLAEFNTQREKVRYLDILPRAAGVRGAAAERDLVPRRPAAARHEPRGAAPADQVSCDWSV